MHKDEGLDLSNVISFNLDEYYPIQPDSLQSYHRFMWDNFFSHVNIPKENVHIPDGTIARGDVDRFCRDYELAIAEAGGIDLILLGIGRTGHIGFSEPGSAISSLTRMVVLDEITRQDAASDFFGEDNVPHEAITMGVKTILECKEIILMATGEKKAAIVRRAVEGAMSDDVPASYLQTHAQASFFCDAAASADLTRVKTPWLVGEVTEWPKSLAMAAVIWLCHETGKAIHSLSKKDFQIHHLHALVHAYNHDVDTLCLEVFNELSSRILQKMPTGEKVVVFSPHPDDDVICMGGLMSQMVRNQCDIVPVYCTNGSVAVFDADLLRHLRFVEMSCKQLLGDGSDAVAAGVRKTIDEVTEFMANKKAGEIDTIRIQNLKAHIRYTEAQKAVEVLGVPASNTRFMDLPFYQTGTVQKKPISDKDVQITLELLRKEKPSLVFVAGDLSDPHGTHRMCYFAIREALRLYTEECGGGVGASPGKKAKKAAPTPTAPAVWLYRGAWIEYAVHETDVFLPLSAADLARKIDSIYCHESQKDRAAFPGTDEREFWERARDRNTDTAAKLNELGLPEFHAVECFVKVEPDNLPM